jgi:hypothetical protein
MCGNDQAEAQQVTQSVQRYMAARIGLTSQRLLSSGFREHDYYEDNNNKVNNNSDNGMKSADLNIEATLSYDVADDEIFYDDSLSDEFNNKMSF